VPRRIVILGGGVGGVAAARFLSGELRKNKADAEVLLIAKEDRHYMPPLFFDVAMGEASPEETHAPIRRLETRFGVKVLIDPATRIDAANRTVYTAGGQAIGYDHLIVALGTTMEWSRYPGLAEAGHHNYTLPAALELRRALAGFRGGEVAILVPESPHRCGIYPYEIATVLAASLRNAGINARVKVLTPDPKPVTPLGPDLHKMWFDAFEELGVEYIVHKGLEEVDPKGRIVRIKGAEERYDLLIKVPPPGLPEPLRNSEGFTVKGDPRWAPVKGPTFRHPDYDDVYMIGEHSMAPAGLSLAGVFVHNAAMIAGHAILADILGSYVHYAMPTATCAGYLKDKAFTGHCEVRYNPEKGKYEWNRCYLGMVSSLARLFKYGFYRSWLDTLS